MKIPYWIKRIYWFLQRGYRGFGDNDTWDFDYYMAKVITGGLKHFKIYYKGQEPSKEVIDKIIEGFNCAILLVDEPSLEHNEKIEAERIREEGFNLFKKYFNYFWS